MHALGNDFILIDYELNKQIILDQKNIQICANRKYGIGCDQILFIKNNNLNHYDYSVFNCDGSKALNCLNGARCVIKYLYIKSNRTISQFILNLSNGKILGCVNKNENVELLVDEPNYLPDKLPMSLNLNESNLYTYNFSGELISFAIASVGNPHVMIHKRNSLNTYDILELTNTAKNIQHSAIFPQGVNVNFYNIYSNNIIHLMTYERGVGFTDSCGSGACVTACYLIKQKKVTSSVDVSMIGGVLRVMLQNNDKIAIVGDANWVFTGCIEL